MNYIKDLININLKHKEKLSAICNPLFELLHVSYFNYFSIFPLHNPKRIVIINPSVHILQHYLTNKYYLCDPHIVTPKNLHSGFVLWSSYNNAKYQGQYIYDLREKFNIDNGITFIKKTDAYCHGFCFGSTKTNYNFFTDIFCNTRLLQYFSNYFISKTKNLFSVFAENSLDIAQLKGKRFISQRGITSNYLIPEIAYNNLTRMHHLENVMKGKGNLR